MKKTLLIFLFCILIGSFMTGCNENNSPVGSTVPSASNATSPATPPASATPAVPSASATPAVPSASATPAAPSASATPAAPAASVSPAASQNTNSPSSSSNNPNVVQKPESTPTSGKKETVFMTTEISPKGLQAAYNALDIKPNSNDKVAVKVSTGEPPSSNYLRQDLIGDFVKGLKGTYVENNTAYGGQRASTAMHYQVAKDHGFEPIVLMDDGGDMEIPIDGGLRLKTDTVGKHLQDFNFYVVLSHFKGHQIAGYGGALKQLSIGSASFSGKNLIHTGGKNSKQWFGGVQDEFLESMADASKGVVNYIKKANNGQVIYINVMNRLSIDCDCNGRPSEPDIHDIGILSSTDPVALDQACIDLIYKAEGNASFVRRLEAQHGIHVLEAADKIGLGSRTYDLVTINN